MPAPESGVLRKLLARTRRKNVKRLRGIHQEFIAPCSTRTTESQQTVHLRDALVYTDRCFSGARERKDNLVGTIAEPRTKRRTMAAESENTLRESHNASQAK
jgi:hypothetical protein